MKNPTDEKVANDIRDHGWHCLHVAPRAGEESASFSYTIGLVSSYHHPELMIFGLGREKSHHILNRAGFPGDFNLREDGVYGNSKAIFT